MTAQMGWNGLWRAVEIDCSDCLVAGAITIHYQLKRVENDGRAGGEIGMF